MANETITGCVNFGTGKVKFDQDACTYYGCMIWDGDHARQVAVTISTIYCNDTYYGCVDFSTGKFEVNIPDYCCTPPSSCECEDCLNLDSEYYMPDIINVKFYDLVNCDSCLVANSRGHIGSVNDVAAELTVAAGFDVDHLSGCLWEKTWNFTNYWRQYWETDCTNIKAEYTFDQLRIDIFPGFLGAPDRILTLVEAHLSWTKTWNTLGVQTSSTAQDRWDGITFKSLMNQTGCLPIGFASATNLFYCDASLTYQTDDGYCSFSDAEGASQLCT